MKKTIRVEKLSGKKISDFSTLETARQFMKTQQYVQAIRISDNALLSIKYNGGTSPPELITLSLKPKT